MTEHLHYKRRFLLWGLLLAVGIVWVPVRVERADALSGGPDAFGYNWRDNIDHEYEVASLSPGLADNSTTTVAIDFDFEFYGQSYDTVTLSSEGAMVFSGDLPLPEANESLVSAPYVGIFPFWDDLDLGGGGNVYYDTTGMSPNRVFLAEWRAVPHAHNNPPYYCLGDTSFVVKLFEADDSIEFHYADVLFGLAVFDGGASATVGIVDADQGYYLQVSHDAIALSDGYSLRFEPPGACVDDDGDGWTPCDGDCDETDAAIHPGATEVCDDGIDSNCDGAVDENADADGDGYSNCTGDCDDGEADAYPGNTEVCDFIDNDCDGWIDNGFDEDLDGWSTCEGDCDDTDAGRYPSATELCDGVDSDCLDDLPQTEQDNDGDGYSECEGDCNDSQAAAYPGAEEICDGEDNDCDPETDENADSDFDNFSICTGDCNDGDAGMSPAVAEICDEKDNDCNGQVDDGIDEDYDGYLGCGGEDCNDYNAGINPAAQEIPYDNIDQDCDGSDLKDVDGDGHDGGAGRPDCNDDDPDINPDATEICDNDIDDNCDGAIDIEDETCQGGGDDDGGSSCACSAADGFRPSSLSTAALLGLALLRRRR